jgi:copper chaperone
MSVTTLTVSGMTCQHCAMAVTKALKSIAGVESAEVSLEQRRAVVVGNTESSRLIQAIEKAGYRADLNA